MTPLIEHLPQPTELLATAALVSAVWKRLRRIWRRFHPVHTAPVLRLVETAPAAFTQPALRESYREDIAA